MKDEIRRISELIVRELQGRLSDPEKEELQRWLDLSEENRDWHEGAMAEQRNLINYVLYDKAASKKEAVLAKLMQSDPFPKAGSAKIIPLKRFNGRSRIAIAAVLAALAFGSVLWIRFKPVVHDRAGTLPSAGPVAKKNDVAPGGNKAVLTLANGTQIVLDDAKKGTIATQGGTHVLKLDSGQVAYNTTKTNQEVVWNMITTPRGGQYQVVLPDGTNVYLNAASSLRFPTSFTGNERRVLLTGEGYFAVKSNKDHPFIVQVGNMSIDVLGTRFDVMAYEEEKTIATTLLEGSVKVSRAKTSKLLKAGDEARLQPDGSMHVVNDPEAAERMVAWVSGQFEFKHDELESVMRQLARWYDVDVVYEDDKTKSHRLTGIVSRDNNASDVLMMLEAGGAHFRIEGRKIIVLP